MIQTANPCEIKIDLLRGGVLDFKALRGKPVLIVNVASGCGFTPQYGQLQELQDHFGDQITIVGVPCNDFGGQEPGDADTISHFCRVNYGVTFHITEKINILKQPVHPLYAWLTGHQINGVSEAEVAWNFTKFVLDKDGRWQASFPSSVSPLDEPVLKALHLL